MLDIYIFTNIYTEIRNNWENNTSYFVFMIVLLNRLTLNQKSVKTAHFTITITIIRRTTMNYNRN